MGRGKDHLEIWTIGHSTHPICEFIDLLSEFEIEVVADVRRYPGSRRFPQYNLPQFAKLLASGGVDYLGFPQLGGRRRPRSDSQNTAWRNAMFRGYADHMETEEFRDGIQRLLAVAQDKRTCLMCAEVLWWRCHRGLIADWLKSHEYVVWHILSKGKVQEHPYTSAARVVRGRLSYRLPAAKQHAA